MKITKGIYRCGIDDDVYLYFTGHISNNWAYYVFLNDADEYSTSGQHTSCTLDSGRYKPENLLIPCKSYKEALHLFTPEQSPELFI